MIIVESNIGIHHFEGVRDDNGILISPDEYLLSFVNMQLSWSVNYINAQNEDELNLWKWADLKARMQRCWNHNRPVIVFGEKLKRPFESEYENTFEEIKEKIQKERNRVLGEGPFTLIHIRVVNDNFELGFELGLVDFC
ncbi:MAG: hypothetical protein ACOC2U_01720 [bacterium]